MFLSTFHPNNAARGHWLVQIPWKCNLGCTPAGWSVATVNLAFLLDAADGTFSLPLLLLCCSHRIPVFVPSLVSYLVLGTEWKLFGKAKSKTLPSTFLINVHFFLSFLKFIWLHQVLVVACRIFGLRLQHVGCLVVAYELLFATYGI